MRIIFFTLLIFCSSCANSPLRTGEIADDNKYSMTQVEIGMTKAEVKSVMGRPDKVQVLEIDGQNSYDIWCYLTEAFDSMQSKPLKRNYTPFVFKEGILTGFGKKYLLHLEQDEFHRKKLQHKKENKYTNDKEEWPKNEHGYVPPPPHESSPEKLKENKSRGQDPMPVYEDEEKVEKKKKKLKKAPRKVCPDSKSSTDDYGWWD